MIRSAHNIDDGAVLETSVCIVGAGPAGIGVALKLEENGIPVILLEAGGMSFEEPAQSLMDGTFDGENYPPLRDTRMSAFGGSTALWAGWCRPFDPLDFEKRPGLAMSGWPFARTELDPAYSQAQRLIGLDDCDDNTALLAGGGKGLLVQEGETTRSIVFSVNAMHFGAHFKDRLDQSLSPTVITHAAVQRFHLQPASDRIANVTVKSTPDRCFSVQANHFVLAAGGIENARLLLLSGDDPSTAIGNQHGLVGKYFSDHAFFESGWFIPKDPDRSLDSYFPSQSSDGSPNVQVRAALSLNTDLVRREQAQNLALFFLPAYEAHPVFEHEAVKALLEWWEKTRGRGVPSNKAAHLAKALKSPHLLAHAVARKLMIRKQVAPRWRLRGFMESEPLASNTVSLGQTKDRFGRATAHVHWRLSDFDLHCMSRAHHWIDEDFQTQGIGRLELAAAGDLESWRQQCFGGKHHMGTTRMADAPSLGVTDANAKIHGIHNLYIAGSSLFPTGSYVNPTLTIIALALRLAEHLASQKG